MFVNWNNKYSMMTLTNMNGFVLTVYKSVKPIMLTAVRNANGKCSMPTKQQSSRLNENKEIRFFHWTCQCFGETDDTAVESCSE